MDVLDLAGLLDTGPSFDDLKRSRMRELMRSGSEPQQFSAQPMAPMPQMPQPARAMPARAMPAAQVAPQPPAAPPVQQPIDMDAPPTPTGDPLEDRYRQALWEQKNLYGQMADASKPVDLTAMQDTYRKNQEMGNRNLVMALAAQEAGLGDVSGMHLKKAMSASSPMKMAGGTMTEGGFIEDPMEQREIALKRLDAKIRQNEAGIKDTLNLKERRAREAQNDLYRQEMLDIRRGSSAASSARSADAAADRKANADYRRIDNIRKEYDKRAEKIRDGVRFADAVMGTLTDPSVVTNAPMQIATIMQFGKMLDEQSVVREAEQRMIANARGLLDTLMMQIPRLQTGAVLSKTQLDQMRDVALKYQQGSHTRIDDLNELYAGLSQRNGLPVEDIVLGYKGSAGQAGPPPGSVRVKGAPAAAPVSQSGPPPGAVRVKGQ